MVRKFLSSALALFALCALTAEDGRATDPERFKVLAVMSYHDAYEWQQEIIDGIDAVLKPLCEVRYFSMDTKRNLAGGAEKAKEALEIFNQWKPDGVIAADDNAQSMFVILYLKDKTKCPVMFCGVNGDASRYGYPASNVSGIIEIYHIRESMEFAKQLVPGLKKIAFIMKNSPTAFHTFSQIKQEMDSYPLETVRFRSPNSVEGLVAMTKMVRDEADLLFITTISGLKNREGETFNEDTLIPTAVETFGKPTITDTRFNVEYGVLCSVVQTGQEQGSVAAEKLLKAIKGTPVSEIPISRNEHGQKIVNEDTMKALGISPDPALLKDVEMIRTRKTG